MLISRSTDSHQNPEGADEATGYYQGNRYARFGDNRVMSAFQPIYSIAHRRIVGLEALARGVDAEGDAVSPMKLFASADTERLVELDRICQRVHLENFHAIDPPTAWLFLNVAPYTLSHSGAHPTFLAELLAAWGYEPNRVVIEVLESSIERESDLEDTIQIYRDMGFLIAIDDFGAGHSNFERIWRIRPDIVKLDRSMLKKAGTDASVRDLLRGITNMLHNCKCLVLAEGVETRNEALAAMDAQVDLVQGYHFARPFLLSESLATQQGLWQTLYNEFDELSAQYAQWRQQQISPYLERFTALTVGKDKRQGLAEIADNMFGMSLCIRLFELTPDGEQCHANLNSPHMQIEGRDRLQALANARGASWKRRDYYVRAINQPGVVQTTRPYFSIADGTLCRTLSVLTQLDGEDFIVCCDILYKG